MKINDSWDLVLREERLKMNDYIMREIRRRTRVVGAVDLHANGATRLRVNGATS